MAPECKHCGATYPDTASKCTYCGTPPWWAEEIPTRLTPDVLKQMVLWEKDFYPVSPYARCSACGREYSHLFTFATAYFHPDSGVLIALTCFICQEPNDALNAQIAAINNRLDKQGALTRPS